MNNVRRQGLLKEGRRNRWVIVTPEGERFFVPTKIADTFCMPGQVKEVFFCAGERQKNMREAQAENVSLTLTFSEGPLPKETAD